MGYPVKTSSDNWLNKAIELYYRRVSISIIDDDNYGVKDSKDIRKIFSTSTMQQTELLIMYGFYVLAIVCVVLLVMSFSLAYSYAKVLGIVLSSVGIIVCLFIPRYYLKKNKAAKIILREDGIDVKFN